MPTLDELLPNLIHVGALLYLVCFLFRNQIILRLFAVGGDLAYIGYYSTVAERPLWEAIAWAGANILINIAMILMILRDHRMTTLSDDEMSLYQDLRGLSPGQFRRLMRLGKWLVPDEKLVVTEEGKPLDRLYYVLSGEVEVDISGRKVKLAPSVFIGELAYLRKKPATATVTADKGAKLVSWSHQDLATATAKDEGLGAALGILLSNDMAEKIARA